MPISHDIKAPIAKRITCHRPAFFSASIFSRAICSADFGFVSLSICCFLEHGFCMFLKNAACQAKDVVFCLADVWFRVCFFCL